MELNIDEKTSQQLHKILQDLAHFIALYEQTDDKLTARQEGIDQQVISFKKDIQQELQNIKQVVSELTEVMTAAGAARWRIAAEKAMQEGEAHLKDIKEATKLYQKLADDSVSRLEHVSLATEKRIGKALHQLNEDNFAVVDEFKRRTDDSFKQIDTVAKSAIENVKRLMRWLRWDRVGIAVIAALLASLLTSIYVNAEWPWQSHGRVLKERLIGRTLLTTWPSLSDHQKAEINQILGQEIS